MWDQGVFDSVESGCPFDYSTAQGRAEVYAAIPAVLRMRAELTDPTAARRVDRDERLYEWTLGLAVIPMLAWRAVRALAPHADVRQSPGAAPDFIGEIRQELLHDSMSPKIALYERSLGLAVVLVLIRQAARGLTQRLRRR